MATPILMPKQGNTVEECILVAWRKNKGEQVKAGEVIAEIETDKAAFELEAPDSGVLLDTFFNDGDVVPVLINIGVIGSQGEDPEPFRPPLPAPAKEIAQSSSPGPEREEPQSKPTGPVQTHQAHAAPDSPAAFSPRARQALESLGTTDTPIHGTGPGGRILESDVLAHARRTPRLSFTSRRMVRNEQYRVPAQGTGINGLILTGDLLPPGKALSRLRQVVASRMKSSLADTAQFTLHASASAEALLNARKTIKGRRKAPDFVDVNLNDMVMFTVIHTLTGFPHLNAEFIEGKVYIHEHVNIAFACDTPKGLIVPVIKKSENLSLAALSTQLKQLADMAQIGAVPPDQLSGGSLTVSNLGVLGIEHFTPILNPPQVAIIGVGAITTRPVRQKDRTVQFVDKMGVSLTIDHQAVDGAPAARFLHALCRNIEQFQLPEK